MPPPARDCPIPWGSETGSGCGTSMVLLPASRLRSAPRVMAPNSTTSGSWRAKRAQCCLWLHHLHHRMKQWWDLPPWGCPIDSRAHQDLQRRIACYMGYEEVVELEDPVVNILTPEGPFRVLLPLIKTIQTTTKNLWETPASILQHPRGWRGSILYPSKGRSTYSLTHNPAHWWW